ncbi:MAG: hypothetical protein Fur002_20250 [Anaerolineales bacterium]
MPEPKRPLKVFLCPPTRIPLRVQAVTPSHKGMICGLYARPAKDGVDAWLDKAKLLANQNPLESVHPL